MKKLFLGIIAFVILTSSSCDKLPFGERFYGIRIENKSPKSIYFLESRPGNERLYPDTTLPTAKPALVKIEGGRGFTIDSRVKWETVIESLPADTLSIYILDAKTYEAKDWSEVRDKYLILKRYDLSLEDLKSLNWKVTYPADSTMKGIKMYP